MNVQALFKKAAAPAKPAKKAAAKPVVSRKGTTTTVPTLKGGAGYRKYQGDALWLPNTSRPEWLDGSLPGDRGFDPLGLSRPSDFVQVGVDENNINAPKNFKGGVEGVAAAAPDQVSATSLSPYSEVFGLQRFRECELLHGRWAMLATLGCLAAEFNTGINWSEAQLVELRDGPSYAGLTLPFNFTVLAWLNSLLMGGVELFRNAELDPEKRIYPGGAFDPLRLASDDPERAFRLKTAEIKHGRLAMVAFLGFLVQQLVTGEGVLGSLQAFGKTF